MSDASKIITDAFTQGAETIDRLTNDRNTLLARVKELEGELQSMTIKASQYRNALYGHVEFPSQGASWERVAEMDTKMKDLEESLKLKEAAYGVLVDVNTDLSHQLHQRDTALVNLERERDHFKDIVEHSWPVWAEEKPVFEKALDAAREALESAQRKLESCGWHKCYCASHWTTHSSDCPIGQETAKIDHALSQIQACEVKK